jgi:hypothetical protein
MVRMKLNKNTNNNNNNNKDEDRIYVHIRILFEIQSWIVFEFEIGIESLKNNKKKGNRKT